MTLKGDDGTDDSKLNATTVLISCVITDWDSDKEEGLKKSPKILLSFMDGSSIT